MTILEPITSTGRRGRDRSHPSPATQRKGVDLGRSFAVVLLAVLTILTLSGAPASAGDTGSLRFLENVDADGDTDPASGTWTLDFETGDMGIGDMTYNRRDLWVSDMQMGGTIFTDTACSELDNPVYPHDRFLGDGSGHISVYDDAGVDRDISLSDITIEGHTYSSWDGGMEITGRWEDPYTGRSGYFFSEMETSNVLSGERLCYANGWSSSHHVFYFVDDNTADIPDAIDVMPPGFNSEQCKLNGGDRIVDSTTAGVRTFVYVYQPTGDEVWVCARVEDTSTGEGYGGRLEATPADADPQVTGLPGTPSTDGDSTACTTTTPNDVPGSHPISSGGVGPVDYMVDAYADDDEAWVCLQVGSSDHRVVVPLGSGSPDVQFGTVAYWHPDEGTPGS